MPHEWITCSLCGTQYDPAEHTACAACPLNQGCRQSCCPHCGASNINPDESRLVRLIKRLFQGNPA